MKKRMIFLVTVLAVMFGGTSAVGLAQEDETPEANTVFVATVDSETNYIKYHVCSLNAENTAEAAECEALVDDFGSATYGNDFWTAEIEVESNGEYNHGSFVSAFAEAYEGEGKGCLVRYIAQSDWGKPESTTTGDQLLIEAETFCAFNKNGDTEAEGDGPPPWAGKPATAGEGKPPWAGPDGDKSQRPGKGDDSDD